MKKSIYKNRKQPWVIIALWVIGLGSLIALGVYLIKENAALRYQYKESKEIELSKKIYNVRQSVSQELSTIMLQLQKGADEFNKKNLKNLSAYLTHVLESMPISVSGGIAFKPYEYDSKEKLHALYMVKNDNNEFKELDIQRYYNYLDTEWYKNTFGKKLLWHEPFLEVSTNSYILRLSTTIYTFDPTTNTRLPIAVLFIDVSQSELNKLANSAIYNPHTYAFIISSKDTLISYPIESYLRKYKTLFGISQLPGKNDWHRISKLIHKQIGGLSSYQDNLSHERYWVTFEPLSISDWFIVYVTQQESFFDIPALSHNIIQLAGLLCILLIYISLLITYLINMRHKKWFFSILISICFFALTFLQLYLNAQSKPKYLNRTIIKNKIDLSRFKKFQQQRDKQLRKPEAIFVPTGIMLKSILPISENKLEIQGFIWQKYDTKAKNIKKSIGLFNAEKIELNELYQVKEGDTTTIGWKFNAILNVIFDQSRYPFNILKLNIPLYNPNLDKNVILIPDFDSYDQYETRKVFGISKNVILGKGIKLNNIYFSYTHEINQSNLGLTNNIHKEDFPDLSFEVNMSKGIVNPLIAYLLPLFIISIILFYILLAQIYLSQESPSYARIDLLGQTGAIFLALVLSHNGLRSILQVSTIAYLECYYFIMYVFTFLIASSCMIQHIGFKIVAYPLVFFHNYLIYFYWPLIMQYIFIITLYFFY